jgi:threonine/homoserine/homoserine lactone efflux protein
MLEYLLTGAGLGFAGAIQPGPFQTFVISEALRKGWRQALPAALAPLISDLPIILLALFVLTRVPPTLQRVLYVVSGLYILYLAWHAWQVRCVTPAAETASDPARSGALRAAAMNLLSPGPYIFWSLIAGPMLLQAWQQSPAAAAAFLLGFYGAMVGTLAALIVVFGAAGGLNPRVAVVLTSLSAIILAAFGVRQLWLGLGLRL